MFTKIEYKIVFVRHREENYWYLDLFSCKKSVLRKIYLVNSSINQYAVSNFVYQNI